MADILKLNNNKITITDDVIDGRVLVSKTVNVGGLLQALAKLATGDNAAILKNANLAGANLTWATMSANADTKSEFKAVVGAGNWDAVTTIWVDGEPIGE